MIALVSLLWTIGSVNAMDMHSATCGVSPLGYQCWKQVCQNIEMHWTLGEFQPDSGCRYLNGPTSNATDQESEYIHIALVTDLSGYVALSLPQKLGQMSPADSIIAFGPSNQNKTNLSVHPYFLDGYDAPTDMEQSISILYQEVVYDAQSQKLTACFSRPIIGSGGAGSTISLSSNHGVTGFNFAAGKSHSPSLHRHEMDPGHLCSASIALIAVAVPGGEAAKSAGSSTTAVVCHGIMMILAWALLLPLGIISARHRWIFPSPPLLPSPSHKPPLATWFIVHRALQLSGVAVFSIAFLLPWVAFHHGHHDHGEKESVAMTLHGPLGIAIAVLTYLQVVLAFFRPKPDALPIRSYWNNQHWWTGRLAVIFAFLQICFGIQLLKEAEGMNHAPWIAVFVLLLLLVVGSLLFLELRSGLWHRYSALRQSDTLREVGGPSLVSSGNNSSLSQPFPLGTQSVGLALSEDGFEDATPLLANNSTTHYRSAAAKE